MDQGKSAREGRTFRRFKTGESTWDCTDLSQKIFQADRSYKCPTYVHRTPPCQGSCPSGHDIRGWLNIVRGLEKAPAGMTWQEYAFLRMVESNPFPAIMGRVCPAPCEDGCNRNEVEGHVGINSIEHYIGDYALEQGLKLPAAGASTGKKVAIVGGGPAGLACAYFLRRQGHACTIFESKPELGGMMRYGIPGYRTPRAVLDGEIKRILDMGVDVRMGVKIGVDVTLDEIQQDFNAVFFGTGAHIGTPLDVPGAKEANNCISGIAFLAAFNEGRLQHGAQRVLVIGGGDTAMDVAAVARRLGHIEHAHEKDHPAFVVLGQTTHDVAISAKRQGAEVSIVYRRPIDKMPATKSEIEHVTQEGVQILPCLIPVEVVHDAPSHAHALRVAEVDWTGGKMTVKPGTERDIECDLIVSAIGQAPDFGGFEALDNGKGAAAVDAYYRSPKMDGVFAGGDVIKPHLITTAIGHAWIAAQSIGHQLKGEAQPNLPKVNAHHFDLIEKLKEAGKEPADYDHVQAGGTDRARYAVHNFEDRAKSLIVNSKELFLGHFKETPQHARSQKTIDAENVLGNFETRLQALSEKEARAEADRCMSCGLCFECDNCLIYCPQKAVHRVKKSEATMGRYVDTDYAKCIGCHICKDVCPTGYIQMGLGE
jgi:NADPH-dependent glutamate synthase beta subunit-like oxidoreductase/formate hydrogenlyase subunit 6/NADH:ubiquinone oxidoreductase subunit I